MDDPHAARPRVAPPGRRALIDGAGEGTLVHPCDAARRGLPAKLAAMNALRLARPSLLGPALLLAAALAACSDPQTPATATGTAPTSTSTDTSATSQPTSTAPVATGTTTTTTGSDWGATMTEGYVLTFEQSGGIAGMRMVTVVDTAKKTITYGGMRNDKPETRDLAKADLDAITRAVADASPATFPGIIKGPPMADAFGYSIRIEAGGKKASVGWSDGSTVPEVYKKLEDAVFKARVNTFEGNKKGATM